VSRATNSKGPLLTEIMNLKNHYHSQYSVSLRAKRSRDRIPVEARFSATVQTGPWAHPASYTIGTRSFPGVKWPGRGVDHPPHSSADVKERVQQYLDSPSGTLWPVIARNFTVYPDSH